MRNKNKVLNQLENKRKMVMDLTSKRREADGRSQLSQVLEGHVKKLKEAWDDTRKGSDQKEGPCGDNL